MVLLEYSTSLTHEVSPLLGSTGLCCQSGHPIDSGGDRPQNDCPPSGHSGNTGPKSGDRTHTAVSSRGDALLAIVDL